MKRPVNQQKAAAGSKGGKTTVKRYGKRYMRRLAKWAAHRMHSTYRMVPVGTNNFAYVNRETGEVKAYQFGKPEERS